MDDWELLQDYVGTASERAFAQLVARHADMVFSTCLRCLKDAHAAEDATQTVFLILAMKARSIRRSTVLSGWLFNAARFAAADIQKSDARRRRREREAKAMITQNEHHDTPESNDPVPGDVAALSTLLDDALAQLGEIDRNAVLLRFFERKSLRETGVALGLSEGAAEKRVSRAVEKLQSLLGSAGAVLSGRALMLTLPALIRTAPSSLHDPALIGALAKAHNSALLATRFPHAPALARAMGHATWKAVAGVSVALGLLCALWISPIFRRRAAPLTQPSQQQAGDENAPVAPNVVTAANIVGEAGHIRLADGKPFQVALFPDGKHVLCGGKTTLHVVELATGKETIEFANDLETIRSVALSPSGAQAVSGNAVGLVQLWDVEKGHELRRFDSPHPLPATVAFSPDGKRILAASGESLVLWNAETGVKLQTFSGHTQTVTCMAFVPKGNRILSGSADGSLRLWDLDTGSEVRAYEHNPPAGVTIGNSGGILALACSPDGISAVACAADGAIFSWDLTSGLSTDSAATSRTEIRSLAFSPDGRRWIAAGGGVDRTRLNPQHHFETGVPLSECRIRIWNVATDEELATFDTRDIQDAVVIAPDGRSAVSCGDEIHLWRLPK